MTPTTNDLSLTVSRTIEAPVEKVFDAWLDADMLSRFMTPGEDVTVPSVAVDAVEGGSFEILMKVGEKELPHSGIYKTIDRCSRLVFTWESPHSIDGSTVTLDFRPVDGGTEVTLTQVRFSSEDSRDGHGKGWAAILSALESTTEPEGGA